MKRYLIAFDPDGLSDKDEIKMHEYFWSLDDIYLINFNVCIVKVNEKITAKVILRSIKKSFRVASKAFVIEIGSDLAFAIEADEHPLQKFLLGNSDTNNQRKGE